MSDSIDEWVNDIHCGDAVATLREMPESSVHMVMCSPPYYGLRDYGVDGQIGLEESLAEYIQSIVEVGNELQRVLRDDGNWWLNLGDTFASKPRGNKKPLESTGLNNNAESFEAQDASRDTTGAFQQKQKMLVPHRVAIALQDVGWVVRGDCVWSKPNPMPDPVKDRLREDKEFLFHLTPGPNYWFDMESIREPHSTKTLERRARSETSRDKNNEGKGGPEFSQNDLEENPIHPNGKNPGDVFEITVRAFPDAHFAVYPPELCEKPIKASCPEDGVVLDPFAGAGTTCLVAKQLGRRFIGIDLNPDYVAMAQKRVGVDVDEPERLLEDGETSLHAFADGDDPA